MCRKVPKCIVLELSFLHFNLGIICRYANFCLAQHRICDLSNFEERFLQTVVGLCGVLIEMIRYLKCILRSKGTIINP